jgi:hypothetical protein
VLKKKFNKKLEKKIDIMYWEDNLLYQDTFLGHNKFKFLNYELAHHLSDIGEILFFLLAAMTIVELIDAHQ